MTGSQTIKWNWWRTNPKTGKPMNVPKSLKPKLDEEALGRAQFLLGKDYREGDLVFRDPATDVVYRGWWTVVTT